MGSFTQFLNDSEMVEKKRIRDLKSGRIEGGENFLFGLSSSGEVERGRRAEKRRKGDWNGSS
jgi:hypothetical protein